MPHTKKESKSIEKQIMKTNLIDYDIIDNMARNKFLPSSVFQEYIHLLETKVITCLELIIQKRLNVAHQ